VILTEANGGTRLSSTRYVHYGTITATLKTGRWGGVVTAFITMSDIKDEIDWEFPGSTTTQAQSNFFWQGIIPTDKTNGATHNGLSDTYSNFHDYTIDWQPDTLTFSIDGKAVRTVKKSDTVDSNGVAHYPTTPSRVQLSIWPAGIAGTAPGTVTWAGGMINWADADYKAAGQFYALVKSVTIKCTNAQPVSASSNITSYVYGGNRSDATPKIVYSNRTTLLNAAGRIAPVVGSFDSAVLGLGLGVVLGLNAFLL
jgi:beta-glucanase (GH16 family)